MLLQMALFHSFYDRGSIPLYICTPVSLSMHCVDGHLVAMLEYIKSIYSGCIIKNDRSVLSGKELDIYLPELNIAFEFNGISLQQCNQCIGMGVMLVVKTQEVELKGFSDKLNR